MSFTVPTRYIILLIILTSFVSPCFAQSLDPGTSSRIDSLLAGYDNASSAGCAVGVYKDGKLIFKKSYGMADLEHGVSITPQTVFDIGSTSKQFTATSIVMLAQQNKLSLDDDIRKYLPEIPNYGHTITIRHLLNHTSGIRDYLQLMCASGVNIDDVTTTKDALAAIARQQALNFVPGSEMLYSNSGYMLLSVIVERVSGVSLRTFEQEHIFKPLGMTHTQVVDDHTMIVPNRAIGYSPAEDGLLHRDMSYWEQTGDGAVSTSVEDFEKWIANFEHPTLGGTSDPSSAQQLMHLLRTPGKLNNGTETDYGLGLEFPTWHTLPVVEHDGSWAGYQTEFMWLPTEHLAVVILSNLSSIPTVATKIASMVLGNKLPKGPAPPPTTPVKFDTAAFAPFEGSYSMDEEPTFVLKYWREGETYWSQATEQAAIPIFPSSDSTFFLKVVNASVTFHRGSDGYVNTITLHQHGDHLAHRVQAAPQLTLKQLQEYTGKYYSPELQSTYSLFVKDSALYASHPKFDTGMLVVSAKDKFYSNIPFLNDIVFERAAKGNVQAMLISMGRVRNIRFERLDKE